MARIGIDLERRIGPVDRRIFGQFIEHLGRCIYGGLYDEGSPLADARGFRTDVLDAAPFICVNMGSGTMDEAQAWVEYCNGTGNTSWANLRRAHGHAESYRVKYWGLGNEMYGGWQIGNMNAHDYVKKARAFAMVMKRTDPGIQLIGCGL